MPVNLATLKTRALTAGVFVTLMLTGLFWNGKSFLLLFTIIHFGCWYEFYKLLIKISSRSIRYFIPAGLVYITLPFLCFLDLAFPGASHWLHQNTSHTPVNYLPGIPALIIFSIWINDTMAYITGSLIGKTALSAISPKKTWEGTLGGIFLCVFVSGYLVVPVLNRYSITGVAYLKGTWHGFVIAGICAVFGTVGDLLESKLKRLAVVKDSGSFMPGHGGFLDRFDSLLIAIPCVWLYIYFIIE